MQLVYESDSVEVTQKLLIMISDCFFCVIFYAAEALHHDQKI
jgi:hypothetical protein